MERLKATKDAIEKACQILKAGGVVIFPTETVYGIGALADNKKAISKIYKTKKRPLDKPLAILISSLDQLYALVEHVPKKAIELAEKYWPGPLTMIFKKSEGTTVGVRMPVHKVSLQLIDKCGPLVATSANISGKKDPVSAAEIKIEADLLLDGGLCKTGKASTIINFSVNPPVVLRQGSLQNIL